MDYSERTKGVKQNSRPTLTEAAILLASWGPVVRGTPLLELLAGTPSLVASRTLWGTISLWRVALLLWGSAPPLVGTLHHALCAHVSSHLTVVRQGWPHRRSHVPRSHSLQENTTQLTQKQVHILHAWY